MSYSPSSDSYVYGTVLTLTPVPASGAYFKEWSGADAGAVSWDGARWALIMDSDKTLAAVFTTTPWYLLSISADGGTVSLDHSGPTYETGTTVILTPAPFPNRYFACWGGTNDSELVDRHDGSYSVVMDGHKSLTANFGQSGEGAVSSGWDFSLYLKDDGTVYSWGYNGVGSLGDGTTVDQLTPVPVAGLSGVAAIAGGQYHGLARMEDGTLRSWGYNDRGQLGNGVQNAAAYRTPIVVAGLTGVTGIATGVFHNLAIRTDGTLWVWGSNAYGELGDGTTTNRPQPVQVSGLSDVIAVAGGYHSLALLSDHTVRSWGRNNYGQLGDGSTSDSLVPITIPVLPNVVQVAAGRYHSLALLEDGTVMAWGQNTYGQLGDGTTGDSSVPQTVPTLTNVASIAAGEYTSFALLEDGTVRAWGLNSNRQLGVGDTTNRSTPTPVPVLSDITAISASERHSLALKDDGTLWAWGLNGSGQLGDGTTTDSDIAVEVTF